MAVELLVGAIVDTCHHLCACATAVVNVTAVIVVVVVGRCERSSIHCRN